MNARSDDLLPVCPIPLADYPRVLLAHGGGGKLMHQLIERMFLAAFGAPPPGARHDSAVIDWRAPGGERAGRIAFTTDSFVVNPLFFPGGDIGSLAVYGTVNDLAMSGARPLALSAGFVLEEGLPMETLWRVTASMGRAARAAQVRIVTGDTKVVERGKGDGLYVNTSGLGAIEHAGVIAPGAVRDGDVVLLNGDIGRHGIAVMAAREALVFEEAIESDCAPLAAPVLALLEAGVEIHCLRDLTRGGLASVIVEIAADAGMEVTIDEARIPVREGVRGACELLGLDPLYVANEGRFVAFVAERDAPRALALLREQDGCEASGAIGRVRAGPGLAVLQSTVGSGRVLNLLSGEQLPRIC